MFADYYYNEDDFFLEDEDDFFGRKYREKRIAVRKKKAELKKKYKKHWRSKSDWRSQRKEAKNTAVTDFKKQKFDERLAKKDARKTLRKEHGTDFNSIVSKTTQTITGALGINQNQTGKTVENLPALEQITTGTNTPPKSKTTLYVGIGVAVIVVIGIAFMLMRKQ